jgi:uroporphyrinogen decarboxylase
MAEQMTKTERVRAALKGEEVDRPPVSVWRHFYDRETSAQGLAEAMLAFQERFQWDFMKVNPRASYHTEDWGARYEYTGDPYTPPRLVYTPIKLPDDWERLKVLDVHTGVLGEQLHALRLIAKELKGEVPFLMTVFTPLSVASRLVESEERMLHFLRCHPEKVHIALQVIVETYVKFIRECLALGASGIFFATTAWASYDHLSRVEYEEFGRPYDLKVLQAAQGAEFNLLHICRDRNMLRILTDYPVHAFNWDARVPTNPSLREGLMVLDRTVVGGLPQRRLHEMSPEEVAQEVDGCIAQTGGLRFILAPGCTISLRTPEENLEMIKRRLVKEG